MSEAADLLFDLSLTEEQRITRENLKRFAATEIRAVSRKADEAAAAPAGFYEKTVELGLTLLPIPEEFGGAGVPRSPISNALNAEDLAYGDMSLAIGALTPLSFVNTLIDQGSTAQKENYLPRFAVENFVPATIALMEPRATFDALDIQTSAKRSGNEYVLNGVKTMVALGESAELILVIANTEGEGIQAFIVEKGAAGLTYQVENYMGLRPLEVRRLLLNDVKVPASAKLGEGEVAFNYQRLLDLSRLGLAACVVGVCQSVLDYVVPYVNERVAFGEPISNRQSVAFMVANIAIELEAMRLMVWRAASRAEQGLDFHKEAYLAKVFCSERAMEIGTNGIQLLGGHGFTRDHMVELWYRNVRAMGILEGVVAI
ncbi:MAG TPA: acyl-CoA dehydrogenase family protein [Pseudomonadales bacterium]|nr:acyl-CoA dehydrogenase family protein [Pseudomonadales bacterium]